MFDSYGWVQKKTTHILVKLEFRLATKHFFAINFFLWCNCNESYVDAISTWYSTMKIFTELWKESENFVNIL